MEWKIKKDVMYLRSKNGTLKNKVTVRLTINQLKEILLAGELALTSAGYLTSRKLSVLVEGDGYDSFKNAGRIYVTN